MVARIAPSPITTSVAVGDALSHGTGTLPARGQHQVQSTSSFSADQQHANSPATPPLPTPPGEAFAAAVISGQLAPRPVTTEELRQRLGASWQPPSSPLRLMDKIA